jgi:DNA-binding NarL/FixJ family response regulator
MVQHLGFGNGEKIRVLVADSTRMSSQLFAESLAQDRQFDVNWVEPKSVSILESAAKEKPHVLLVSLMLEDSSGMGLEVTRRLRAAHPETRVVALVSAPTADAIVQAFRAGAQGVFSRDEAPKVLARCISCVHQGQVWANSQELRYVLDALRTTEPAKMFEQGSENVLSKREQEVVCCVAEGLSNREIAGRLKLTEHTVKNYLFRIFDKLGVSSRVEVVLYVFRMRKYAGNLDTAQSGESQPALVKSPAKSLVRMAPTPVESIRDRRSRLQGD